MYIYIYLLSQLILTSKCPLTFIWIWLKMIDKGARPRPSWATMPARKGGLEAAVELQHLQGQLL